MLSSCSLSFSVYFSGHSLNERSSAHLIRGQMFGFEHATGEHLGAGTDVRNGSETYV